MTYFIGYDVAANMRMWWISYREIPEALCADGYLLHEGFKKGVHPEKTFYHSQREAIQFLRKYDRNVKVAKFTELESRYFPNRTRKFVSK